MALFPCNIGSSGGTSVECFGVYHNSTQSRLEIYSFTDGTATNVPATVGATATIRGVTFTITGAASSGRTYTVSRRCYNYVTTSHVITEHAANTGITYSGNTVIECLP